MSKWYERIKKLYDEGRIDNTSLKNYVVKGMITAEEYKLICGEDYEEDATAEDYEAALAELGVE